MADCSTSNALKYQTTNPVVQWLLGRYMERLRFHIEALRPVRVVDLGCGEGLVAAILKDTSVAAEYRGFDVSAEAVSEARRRNPGLSFQRVDVLELEPEPGWADLAVCLEVLEHLDAPEPALLRFREWTRRYGIVSVPWEPYFRIGNLFRGKYLRTWGNHPEHVQHFSPSTLRRFLERFFPVVRVEPCFPWLFGVCERDGAS